MNTAEKCQQLELAPLEMGQTTLQNKCKSSSIWIQESVVGVLGHSKNGPSRIMGFRLLFIQTHRSFGRSLPLNVKLLGRLVVSYHWSKRLLLKIYFG